MLMVFLLVCSSSKQLKPLLVLNGTDLDLIQGYKEKLSQAGIKEYGEWQFTEESPQKLWYVIKKAAQNVDYEEEVFSIYDYKKRMIYRETANSFDGVEIKNLLDQKRSQMVIKRINFGGSGDIFKILDYQNGEIVSLTDNDDTLYSGEVTIIPQYQDQKYYSLPYQVFLSNNLVSKDATATVLRYVDGKYVAVGEFNQNIIGASVKAKGKS
jgi:hypothetical protein